MNKLKTRDDFDCLRRNIADLQKELRCAEYALENGVRTCNHNWSDVTPDHIYEKAYTIPGDPPGTMGVDRQLPCHIPAKTTKQWKRTCLNCGKVETTREVQITKIETPIF